MGDASSQARWCTGADRHRRLVRPLPVHKKNRYLTFAWRVFQFGLVFLLVFMALYVLERLVLVV